MATCDQVREFEENGFLKIDKYLTDEECDLLKNACYKLVEQMNPTEHRHIFTTGKKQKGDDYFLNSGDKICYFYEDGAVNENGDLLVDKHLALNKIGHALHWLQPVFKKITFSPKVKKLAESFGFKDPAVVQSMYIFKQPGFGGEVVPHQDATFLYNDPVNLIGLWIALEDATQENGCLWFVPKSHKGPVKKRMIRNQESSEPPLIMIGSQDICEDNQFIPLEVTRGGLVIIHGQVIHKSSKNTSAKSRHIYTFHLAEMHNTKWSAENWLQPTSELPFPSLYENVC